MFPNLSQSQKRRRRNRNRSKAILSRKNARGRTPRFEPLEERQMLSVVPVMVEDINQDTVRGADESSSYALVGDTTYMLANDGVHGKELWRTDGTEAGTWMVKDINPGRLSSYVNDLTVMGDTLYFRASDENHLGELWESDGTAAGTVKVEDVNSQSVSIPENLTTTSSTLYFTTHDDVHGRVLWKTDGDGTSMVDNPYPNAEAILYPHHLTTMGNTLYFAAQDPEYGEELWKIDTNGASRVADIHSSGSSFPADLTVLGSTLYFTAYDGINGRELWKTNDDGTSMVVDITSGSANSGVAKLTVVDNTLYFTAHDGINGRELWKTNGDGTGFIDINPGSGSSRPDELTVMGNSLYFMATDGQHGLELWKTDVGGGTNMVEDINPDGASSEPGHMTVVGDTLYFRAYDEINGTELWKTNGEGTSITDIYPGSASSNPHELTAVGDTLYFHVRGDDYVHSLWKSDSNGASSVLNALPGSYINQYHLTTVGETLYFTADDGEHGLEYWTIDGGSGNAVMLKDINTITADSSGSTDVIEIDGASYFFADDGIHERALWTSDGTAAGTSMVKDFGIDEASWRHPEMIGSDGKLFISLYDSNGTAQLWAHNVTTADTVLLRDDFPISYLTAFNGLAFFSASDAEHGNELWSSDGTIVGTELFKDIRTGSDYSNPTFLRTSGDYLFFSATGDDGRGGWVTDGNKANPDGTQRFADSVSEHIWDPTEVGDEIFFAANDAMGLAMWHTSDISCDDATRLTALGSSWTRRVSDVEGTAFFFDFPGDTNGDWPRDLNLWTSNGTEATTQPIAMINEGGPHEAGLGPRVVLGDKLYFTVSTLSYGEEYYEELENNPEYIAEFTPQELDEVFGEYHATELWVSDGTEDGTHVVMQFPTYDVQVLSSWFGNLFVSHNQLFFGTYNSEGHSEFWTVNGETAEPVANYVSFMTNIDGNTTLIADDVIHGRELWRLLDDSDPNVSPVVTLPAGMGSVVNVQRDGNDLVVEKGGTELLRAAMGSIAGVTILGAPESEIVIVNIDGLNVSNLPNGLTIIAGEDGTNDNDTLILSGSTTVSNYDYTTGGPESGTITLDRFTVQFEEFEPIIDQLNVVNRTFSIGTQEGQKIVIGDDVTTAGRSLIDDGGTGTFESLSFTSPTNSLAIVGGEGSDEIIIATMDDSFGTLISIEGGDGDDVIDASQSDLPMVLSGGEGDDTLLGGTVDDILDGGAGNDILDGGPGSDDVDGGTGDNEVISDVADGVIVLNEQGTFSLNATFVGFNTADIDWGDGTSDTYDVVTDAVSGSHVYSTKGDYTVVVAAPNADAPEQTLTVFVTVNNVAPDVYAGEDLTIDEGGSVSMAGSFIDPGSFNSHTYEWDFGDGSPTVSGILTVSGIPETNHVFADSGSYVVTLSVSDDESTGVDSFTVTVVNAIEPGLANVSVGSTIVEDGLVTLTGEITDPGSVTTFELECDWGDGNVETFSYASGTSSFDETHQYDSGGAFAIDVTLVYANGGEETAAAVALVTGVRVHESVLQVVGTHSDDGLLIGRIWRDQILVIANFLPGFWHLERFDRDDIQRVEVTLGDGNDRAVVASNVYLPTRLDGGAGNDFLKGGSGDDIILGRDGNDLLVGGRGRDLMIGGLGRDRIVGNRGDDILIGGSTAFDSNDVALLAIMAEWTSGRDYTTRVDNLRGVATGSDRANGSYYLIAQDSDVLNPAATVFDDDARDIITGGSGRDWFLANSDNDDEGRRDRITDLHDNEFADDLDWIDGDDILDDPEA